MNCFYCKKKLESTIRDNRIHLSCKSCVINKQSKCSLLSFKNNKRIFRYKFYSSKYNLFVVGYEVKIRLENDIENIINTELRDLNDKIIFNIKEFNKINNNYDIKDFLTKKLDKLYAYYLLY